MGGVMAGVMRVGHSNMGLPDNVHRHPKFTTDKVQNRVESEHMSQPAHFYRFTELRQVGYDAVTRDGKRGKPVVVDCVLLNICR